MRVARVAGERIELPAAIVRHLARFVDGLFFGTVAYGSMKAPAYQRLGDRWARTMVVDSRSAQAQTPSVWWLFLALGLFIAVAFVACAIFLAVFLVPTAGQAAPAGILPLGPLGAGGLAHAAVAAALQPTVLVMG